MSDAKRTVIEVVDADLPYLEGRVREAATGEVWLNWNGTDHAGLNHVVNQLGYSYMGSQGWDVRKACLSYDYAGRAPGTEGALFKEPQPPNIACADPLPFRAHWYDAHEAQEEAKKRPRLYVAPKGCKDNP